MDAFLDMMEKHKMVVENAGLLPIAALNHLDCRGKKCGPGPVRRQHGCDHHVLSGPARTDQPGPGVHFLRPAARPSGRAAECGPHRGGENGNIIKLDHNQFVSINRASAVELRVTLEAFGHAHKARILEAMKENGYDARGGHDRRLLSVTFSPPPAGARRPRQTAI